MSNENKDLVVSELPALANGSTLVKFQDETMMAVAVQRPRVVSKVRDDVIAEVEAFPDYAERYFYSIPHRSQACEHPTTRACPTCEYVEGASIHAALAIQRYWGNAFSSWMPGEVFGVPETDDHVWAIGTFVDYERNTKFVRPVRASKTFKKRDGKVITLSEDKLSKAINAAGSKAQRNAILAGTPDPLKLAIFTRAKALTVGDEPDKKLEKKHIDAIETEFKKFKIDVKTIERKLGKKVGEWTMADRAQLLGLRNALLDGEASEKIFGSTVQKTQGKAAKGKPKPKPEPAPKAEQPVQVETGEPVDDEEPPPGEAFGDDQPKQDPETPEEDPFTASMFETE